tara:strand:- start:3153 stop:3371 length:219 start_codon:yes stop_codon:yes gene_type:complete
MIDAKEFAKQVDQIRDDRDLAMRRSYHSIAVAGIKRSEPGIYLYSADNTNRRHDTSSERDSRLSTNGQRAND